MASEIDLDLMFMNIYETRRTRIEAMKDFYLPTYQLEGFQKESLYWLSFLALWANHIKWLTKDSTNN